MTSTTFFFIFIPLLAIILLAVNLILAPHNSYQEKDSVFECGFHSFLGQNRTQFSISFFIFALLFLLFDLEILLVYPYIVSGYTNGIYGLTIMLIFFALLTLGFAFELGKNALKIDSRQTSLFNKKKFFFVPISYTLGLLPLVLINGSNDENNDIEENQDLEEESEEEEEELEEEEEELEEDELFEDLEEIEKCKNNLDSDGKPIISDYLKENYSAWLEDKYGIPYSSEKALDKMAKYIESMLDLNDSENLDDSDDSDDSNDSNSTVKDRDNDSDSDSSSSTIKAYHSDDDDNDSDNSDSNNDDSNDSNDSDNSGSIIGSKNKIELSETSTSECNDSSSLLDSLSEFLDHFL